MAYYAVRRLGVAPCTEDEYKVIRAKEKLVKKGDTEGLKKLEQAVTKKVEQKVEGGNA